MGYCGSMVWLNSPPTNLVKSSHYGVRGVKGYERYGLREVQLYPFFYRLEECGSDRSGVGGHKIVTARDGCGWMMSR
jgi:hypothetical protein